MTTDIEEAIHEESAALERKVRERPQVELRALRKAAAGYSRTLRAKRRAAGIPAGQRIDTAIASFVVRMSAVHPLKLNRSNLDELPVLVATFARWDLENQALMAAIEARVRRLGEMVWTPLKG